MLLHVRACRDAFTSLIGLDLLRRLHGLGRALLLLFLERLRETNQGYLLARLSGIQASFQCLTATCVQCENGKPETITVYQLNS